MSSKQGKASVTMSDVAREAGVSRTTVSFVLNGVTNVAIPDVTRERIQQVARDLGYRPNVAAKSLMTNRTHLIGFITDVLPTAPFAGDIIKGAQDAAADKGKLLLVVNAGGNQAIEEAAVELMLERKVESIIYAAMYHHSVKVPYNIYEVPAVMLNCYEENRALPAVFPDEVQGGRDATLALLAQGHRRIGFLNLNTLESGQPGAVGRLEGYKQALASYGVAFDEELVRYGNSMADQGYIHSKELMRLPDPPTAYFCTTDRIAMGLYDALKEEGFAIPRDISIVGFDNQVLIAAYLRPALSTVELPHYAMCRWAVDYLTGAEHPATDRPIQMALKCPYIERDSIAVPRSSL